MKRASQLRTPSVHQEYVRAFVDKMLRDDRQSCPLLTRYEGTFPFELSHMRLCSPMSAPLQAEPCSLKGPTTLALSKDCRTRRARPLAIEALHDTSLRGTLEFKTGYGDHPLLEWRRFFSLPCTLPTA